MVSGAQAYARATGALDDEVTCELAATPESREFLARCVPGAAAAVFIAGDRFEGRVRVTDPDEYVTVVEF